MLPRGSAFVTSRKMVSGLKDKPVPRIAIVTVTSRKSGSSFDDVFWTPDGAPLFTSRKFTESAYSNGLPVLRARVDRCVTRIPTRALAIAKPRTRTRSRHGNAFP